VQERKCRPPLRKVNLLGDVHFQERATTIQPTQYSVHDGHSSDGPHQIPAKLNPQFRRKDHVKTVPGTGRVENPPPAGILLPASHGEPHGRSLRDVGHRICLDVFEIQDHASGLPDSPAEGLSKAFGVLEPTPVRSVRRDEQRPGEPR